MADLHHKNRFREKTTRIIPIIQLVGSIFTHGLVLQMSRENAYRTNVFSSIVFYKTAFRILASGGHTKCTLRNVLDITIKMHFVLDKVDLYAGLYFLEKVNISLI